MSRIGKKPIAIPKGVQVSIQGNVVAVQGPKGKLETRVPEGIRMEQQDGSLVALRSNDSQAALHGAELKAKTTVVFTLGYSHPIEYPLPEGIMVAVDPKQTRLTITGIDRQKVGQVAAEMRGLRPPDPYKNKGVRYAGERLKKKVGKTGAK